MKDTVKFNGYMIKKFVFEKIEKIPKEKKENFTLKCDVFSNDDKGKENCYCVSLSIDMFTDKSKLELTMNGYFEFPKKFDDTLKKEFLDVTAPAILYPYIRTFISNVTSFDIDNTVVLPVINFADKANRE